MVPRTQVCRAELGLSDTQLATLARNSFEYRRGSSNSHLSPSFVTRSPLSHAMLPSVRSGAPEHLVIAGKAAVDAWLAREP